MQSLEEGITRTRGFRIPDSLWQEAKAIAHARRDNLSELVRDTLADYVNAHTADEDAA